MRNTPIVIVAAVNMTSIVNSIQVELDHNITYSIQAVFTGAPVGTLKLQISNDILPSIGNPVHTDPTALVTNWSDYTGSSSPVNGSGNFMWNVADAGHLWVRMVYTPTSGSGTLNATFSGKEA